MMRDVTITEMVRSRRQQLFQQSGQRQQLSLGEMIATLDVHSLLIDAPTTSVRQTIDVERLEDEIVSGSAPLTGSSAVTVGMGSADKLDASISDYDTVSEQVGYVSHYSSLAGRKGAAENTALSQDSLETGF